jgi:Uma2 family endonuclease
MSVALRKPMTLEAFLDWESRQPVRYEFDGFGPVAMAGGTLEQGLIQANLISALHARLRGGPCRVVGSDVKIQVGDDHIRYPEAFVLCSFPDRGATVVTQPVVVFEVLSPSAASVDHIVKNQEYRDTPSIQRYVMLEQAQMAATVFSRQGDDWVGHLVAGDAVLAMPEIGVELPLAELYEGVTFPKATE